MALTLYTLPGCIGCKIVKAFMAERGLGFREVDIKGEGRSEFARFYRENQSSVQRTLEGIVFPICFDGREVRQGPGVTIAWLQAGEALDSFVRQSRRGQGWIDGFDLSGADPPSGNQLTAVLRFLKQQGIKIGARTDGRNSALFDTLVSESLLDEVDFILRGPANVYAHLADRPCGPEEIRCSLQVLLRTPVYRIILPVDAVRRQDGSESDLTPDEAAAAANLVSQATGQNRTPFFIQPLSAACGGPAAFKYRTAARRHMPTAEIMKS